eukprot:CAMPEP_0201149360 /NCGR_PEP_ID=MMETSP0851-20130426/10667_1 /ASSEMBLY_ACC=CAM_ASM_000631 /TAXON_ID=183588 /ORGANISM="Pseudo-nitzschia fraudulenta, Strain WWA7" /LENGTH=372 /DNA_ID=CAMNT_0047425737 /DNA_START=193 /DNA_END=1311 /DNA_ORIENTATION=+
MTSTASSEDAGSPVPSPREWFSTNAMTSKSGLPVCRYALGGSARSTQQESLVQDYCETVLRGFGDASTSTSGISNDERGSTTTTVAPFLFYYNPHRYPDLMRGIRELSSGGGAGGLTREDVFLASGGTDRSDAGMDERLSDALGHSGREYLDLFVLEYVQPGEVGDAGFLRALQRARSWVRDGKIRYVGASTHSHVVGAWMGSLARSEGDDRESDNDKESTAAPILDAMMLRYNMAHKHAAEHYSFPACAKAGIPVMAFTTTRWNRLQEGHPDWNNGDDESSSSNRPKRPPTTPECLSFALQPNNEEWPVEIVLHSARDREELNESVPCLLPATTEAVQEAKSSWREYGDLEWNDIDDFDEYPEEIKTPRDS